MRPPSRQEETLVQFGNWRLAGQALLAASARSGLVQRQLARAPVSASQAAGDAEAWRQLAYVTKDDLLEDQKLAPPFGSRRCAPVEDIGVIVESSGTTGAGKEAHYITHRDWAHISARWADCLRLMGIGPRDIVALTFPVGMAGGGVKHADAYVRAGAKVLRVANLPTRQKLDAMAYYGTSVLVATPSYVDRLGSVAATAGIDPRALPVRRIVVATQSVTIDWVRSVEERWGARLYEWYGTAAGFIAFSCADGMVNTSGERGTLHWDPDLVLQEIVDPSTGRWVEGDARGELIGTPLISEAEPLFRIRSRDEVRFRPPGTCRCGSPWPGIESGTVRRLDGMLKIKGVNVWPAHVEATLFALGTIRDYRVRVALDERGREIIRLDVLAGGEARPFALAERVGAALRGATGLTFEVTAVQDESAWFQETSGEAAKPRRWIDARMEIP